VQRPSRRLDPKVRLLWSLVSLFWALALTVAASTWAVAAGVSLWLPAAVAAVTFPAAVLIPFLRYRRWRYEIRRRDLFLSKGALFHVVTLIPFDRIQFVESRQGPLDRLFRLTSVLVYTAAGQAGSIPGLDPAEAESLREELSKVAGTQSV
jgi:membrane protein YdbS with pleckstrin-like domain